MILFRFLFGSGWYTIWYVVCYILYIVPIAWLWEDIQYIDKQVSGAPQGLGVFSFIIVSGIVILVNAYLYMVTLLRTTGVPGNILGEIFRHIASLLIAAASAVVHTYLVWLILGDLFAVHEKWAGRAMKLVAAAVLLLNYVLLWRAQNHRLRR